MISALCPSRGRPEHLIESVRSLTSLATAPDQVEVLVAVDPDDDQTLNLVRDDRWPDRAVLWVTPERFGYARHYEYYNGLAAMASGDWLMVWNDDGRMLTPGWDAIVHAEAPGVLWPEATWAWPESNTFPLWPAAWTRELGHVSLAWCCDTWMQEVGRIAGVQRPVPFRIQHDRYDDQTAREAHGSVDVGTFWTAEHHQTREADAQRVVQLMAEAGG